MLRGYPDLAVAELRRASAAIGARNRLAYLFAFPAVVVIFAVIVFPFFYNLVLSLSDMSLVRFKDWRVVGLQNYDEVLHRSKGSGSFSSRRSSGPSSTWRSTSGSA